MCAGIRLVINMKIAATKDSGCRCDEVLLECREEQQWFECGTGSIGGFWVAIGCEDLGGLLVNDGCKCGRVRECVGENSLFERGIRGKGVNNPWQKRSCCSTEESTACDADS